ncbi:MAG: SMP-30/gluconolactonase/LRE family protein [Longimicrobiales bacterium]
MQVRLGGALVVIVCLAGCGPAGGDDDTVEALPVETNTGPVLTLTGFLGPEAVRYDANQDVYFVSNFNGDGGDRDGNGYLSRVRAQDGVTEQARFMVGTEEAPLHAPRGMMIVGDTLWVADIDGIHGFSRVEGSHLAFVDFSAFEPGFLNDIAATPNGTLYVTDTGRSRLYQVENGAATIALEDERLGPPNGITWSDEGRFLLAPWEGGQGIVRAWAPHSEAVLEVTESVGDRLDGIEELDERILVAVQSDSSIHIIEAGRGVGRIRVDGSPADIAIDTRRSRVAVPFISLNRVDVWDVPGVDSGGG